MPTYDKGASTDLKQKKPNTKGANLSGNRQTVKRKRDEPSDRQENSEELTGHQKPKVETKSSTGKPKGPRRRKILLTPISSDNDSDVVVLSDTEAVTKDTQIQIDDDETLTAVRVELEEEKGDGERPEVVFEKWMKQRMEGDQMGNTKPSIVTIDLSTTGSYERNSRKDEKPTKSNVPADMDHVVAVNERRTKYRYIYRVGQCFPEDDDDVPFIRSKLSFVLKTLQTQNDKIHMLKKKCHELSRSNTTLRDILGIPSPETNEEETLELESQNQQMQQQAYLIVGSQPSGVSSHLPSYRFTLTDRSPATISQSTTE